MIRIKADHKNKKALVSIRFAMVRSRAGLRAGLIEIGQLNVRYARKIICSKNKNGRLYQFRGRMHRASAPGEAPANMTGALVASIDYSVRGSSQMEFGDKIIYGKFLENGTRNMEARPHLAKTVDAKGGRAVLILERNIKARVQK